MSNFVNAQVLKTVHGWGVKKWQNSVHVVVECPLKYVAVQRAIGEEIFSSKAHFVIDSTKV